MFRKRSEDEWRPEVPIWNHRSPEFVSCLLCFHSNLQQSTYQHTGFYFWVSPRVSVEAVSSVMAAMVSRCSGAGLPFGGRWMVVNEGGGRNRGWLFREREEKVCDLGALSGRLRKKPHTSRLSGADLGGPEADREAEMMKLEAGVLQMARIQSSETGLVEDTFLKVSGWAAATNTP